MVFCRFVSLLKAQYRWPHLWLIIICSSFLSCCSCVHDCLPGGSASQGCDISSTIGQLDKFSTPLDCCDERITNLQCTKLIFDVGVSKMEINGFWGSTWWISRVISRVKWGVRIWGTSKVTNFFKIFILITLYICTQLTETTYSRGGQQKWAKNWARNNRLSVRVGRSRK
jgi:hypothetical protein